MARSSATKVFPKPPQTAALSAGGFSAIWRVAMMGAWHLRPTTLIMILVVLFGERADGQANHWGQVNRERQPSNFFPKNSQTRRQSINAEFLPATMADCIQASAQKILHSERLYSYYSVKFFLCEAFGNSYVIGGISTETSTPQQTEKVLELQAGTTNKLAGGIGQVIADDGVIVDASPMFGAKIPLKFSSHSNFTMTLIVRDNRIGILKKFDMEKTQKLGLTLIQGLVEQLEKTIELVRSWGNECSITLPGDRT